MAWCLVLLALSSPLEPSAPWPGSPAARQNWRSRAWLPDREELAPRLLVEAADLFPPEQGLISCNAGVPPCSTAPSASPMLASASAASCGLNQLLLQDLLSTCEPPPQAQILLHYAPCSRLLSSCCHSSDLQHLCGFNSTSGPLFHPGKAWSVMTADRQGTTFRCDHAADPATPLLSPNIDFSAPWEVPTWLVFEGLRPIGPFTDCDEFPPSKSDHLGEIPKK